ncbi:MAG TPA: glycosyltransferase family 4 protein [Blastocatellia bacterium]|nr:glycosyltransferase family 4 protein [Blastocatellia bacterium]
MRICFIADARSPIAQNWIAHFIARRADVHVISSYPCAIDALAGAQIYEAPVAFAGFSRTTSRRRLNAPATASAGLRGRAFTTLSMAVQHGVLPLDVRRQQARIKRLIEQIGPDLVHAMRLPFEGIVAARATPRAVPLLVSVWGNDFTLWAGRNPLIARQTRQTLRRADALHTDCRRDLALAVEVWGFDAKKLAAVLPGAGGVQAACFYIGGPDAELRRKLNIAEEAPVIINARGHRGYVRNDVFFAAIPTVLNKHPRAIFLCVAMQGNRMAEKRVKQFGIAESVRLLPQVAHDEMASLFRLAQVAVSPSLHDGTPNTLLEAMASGCLPVTGRIESVCEWIDDGVNGLLCDATRIDSLAAAIIRALDDASLRRAARAHNQRLIKERADYDQVMCQAEQFYIDLIASHHE